MRGISGPTLRLRPGDVLRIRLVNELPPNTDPVPLDMMLPHHFNTTNFHLHGLHVSPDGISDNIFRSMEPGKSYDIEVVVSNEHTRGTDWYHPHHHGSADVQLTSGMAGALIVEGDFDDIVEIAAATERVLILNEVLFDYRGRIETYDTVWPEASPRFLLSMVSGSRSFECDPGRSSAGASFTQVTRTIFTWRSRDTSCMPSPMTEFEDL
jgi:FtsP/CotA-like multicopper oxidase with cupredoxin domain